MIGEASASTLRTTGGSTSSGRLRGGGADPVADVVGGEIDVAAGDEFDGDVGLAVLRARGDRLQPLEARQAAPRAPG